MVENDLLNWLKSEEVINYISSPQIGALIGTITIGIIKHVFAPTASVVWGIRHGFSFLIPQHNSPRLKLNTRSMILQNKGQSPAKDIELYFNYKPEHFEIWPTINHTVDTLSDHRFIIKFPYLKPKEFVYIELVQSNLDVPEVVNVRAAEGQCKHVNIMPAEVFKPITIFLIYALIVIGIYQSLSWLISIIQWLA